MNYARKYIIITPCITNMGGAQMYVRNKYIYLQSSGWDVEIITSQNGKVYINDLKKFNNIIPELAFYIYLFPKSKQEKIINDIINKTINKQYEKIIIESTCRGESTWAEALAQKIGANHLFYNLQEQDVIKSQSIQNFLIFKHKRHELAGITSQSLYNLFLPFNRINMNESYRLSAHCTNVVEDIPSPLLENIDVEKYDYIIGCLSRLDKPFIPYAITDFIKYVKKHKDKNYLLLLIGGAPDISSFEHNIREMFKNIENAEVFITGYIFPVPAKLLDLCNAFFTSAGSCRPCMRSGIPTISYDANDCRPIGIVGRTTKHTLMRAEDEPEQEFSILMDDILVNNIYSRKSQIQQIDKPDYSSHDEFLSLMSPIRDYFSFDHVQKENHEKKISLILRIIGPVNYRKLGQLKQRIFQ